MGATQTRTDEGREITSTSPRPFKHATVFQGAGDDIANNVKGGGQKILFHLLPTDASKSVDLQFIEQVYIKDGYMICEGAPFGASLDAHVIHPVYGVVGLFALNVPVFGNGWFPLDSDDSAPLPAGLILRLTLKNSTGINGEDPPKEFRLAGRIELYRPS